MALVREKRTEPAKEVEVTTAVVCELCGRRGRGDAYPGGGDYGDGLYDVQDVHVCREEGERYPEGGAITTTTLDICPDCFRDKLVPWFEAQGGKVRTKEVDF